MSGVGGQADFTFDEFGDDPFEDVPPQTIQALEESAILASQFQNPNSHKTDFQHDEIVNLDDYPLPNQSSLVAPQPFVKPTIPSQSVDLQALIQRLEKENASLKASANQAQAQAQTKAGEVTILRKRLEKSTKDYEQRLASLRTTHQESQALSKQEIESIRKEREKIEIDKRFLEHDLVSGLGKRPAAKKPLQPSNRQHQKETATKHKLPFGDGFDIDTKPLVSPKKPRSFVNLDNSTSAPSTPNNRQEKKRKRPEDSPQQVGGLHLAAPSPGPSPWQSFTPFFPEDNQLQVESHSSERDQFFQSLLDFRVSPEGDRLLEVLTRHALPSNPGCTLSSLLLDGLSALPSEPATTDIALTFVITISQMWSRCLQEKYYQVIDVLTRVINRVFSSKNYQFIQETILYVLPSAMKTIDLVAFPISAKAYNESQGIVDESEPPPDIDITACFDLVQVLALACQHSPEQMTNFWKLINIHWVLCLLMEAQPIHHVTFICNLLQTSAQATTFGPLWKQEDSGTATGQLETESLLIERLTALLSQLPAIDSKEPIDMSEVLSFRLTVLHTLQSMAVMPRDGESLVKHAMAIGRMVKFLYHATDLLYSPTTYPEHTHEIAITCINTTMRLLYLLLTRHAGKFDLREKLKMVKGGTHLHLIAFTRLAFYESIDLERGIEPGVSDAAHALLDEFLSPVEGEQLLKMFPSGESTGIFAPHQSESMDIDTSADVDDFDDTVDMVEA